MGVKIFVPFVANVSYFWDTFWTVRKKSENSAPVLVYEAGASVLALQSLKMHTSTTDTSLLEMLDLD